MPSTAEHLPSYTYSTTASRCYRSSPEQHGYCFNELEESQDQGGSAVMQDSSSDRSKLAAAYPLELPSSLHHQLLLSSNNRSSTLHQTSCSVVEWLSSPLLSYPRARLGPQL